MTGPDAGVLLAVDVGTVRVGVAASDPARVLASPVATLSRGAGTAAEVAGIARERGAAEVLVGLPVGLSGTEGAAAAMARSFAAELVACLGPVPVRLVDERLTTVLAGQALRASGVRERARRGLVDQAAAAALLQGVLDASR